ncbi:non-specific lipid-transfer protein 2-like [Henckelia pumila]|uniref:non-specific lipid-transfer protein 2-like n=1 Tax=Henckelia pumila TaxID=405737 RepID=UPI003C6E5EAA
MKKSAANIVAFCCLVVALVYGAKETSAVDCEVWELSPCKAAVEGSGVPSAECCVKMKEQEPCLCLYFRIRNPLAEFYFKSPNGRKVAAACGVTFPTYCLH